MTEVSTQVHTLLTVTDQIAYTSTPDALVIGACQGERGPVAVDPEAAELVEAAAALDLTGQAGDLVMLPGQGFARRVVVVGLGPAQELAGEAVRRAAGVASRSVAGLDSVISTLSAIDFSAAAEGHLLGGYSYDRYRKPAKPAARSIALVPHRDPAGAAGTKKGATAVLRAAVITAEAVALARDLVNTAPNDLPPAAFAERASSAAQAAGLRVEVLDEKQLAAGGYGGILAVGSGSSRPPRLLKVTYAPRGTTTSVALVGKGITFDSGGLSIKPAQHMERMTSDMAGAAAVVATTIAAAAMKLPIAVTAWAPLAENLPSGTSYRPGDVLRHYGGKTVHVLNTDAEGRLVLGDAMARAVQDAPDYLIDAATLTGAQVVALGNRTMAVMGEPAFRDRVAELAREVGEGGWAMPLPPELRESLDSPLADMTNINWDRVGGMLVAGHYLAEFVPAGLPWAHLDVAGPAYNVGKTYGYQPAGATGVPVRTLLAVLRDIAVG